LTKEQADGILTALKGFPLTSVAAPAGVESSAPEVSILLNEADGYTFKPDDVIDVTIPDTMNEADIERYLRYLPLRNTIIFHSGDIAQLIGSTRDPLSRKAFAALFALLSNVGKVEITTPEQARRLAYNTILKDGLSYAVADELPTNELKQAFFEAMKERALIRDRLAEEDRDLAAAYEEGRYKFNNREFEEILGKTLLKRSQMGKTERDADQAASVPLKANSRDNMSSLVFGLQEEILQGKAPPGFLSAVADIIVTDVIMDYRVKNSAHIENTGTINIQTVEAVLKAA
jgi:PAS domain-containing protein